MAFFAPKLSTQGEVIGVETIWQPVDFLWISMGGEPEGDVEEILKHPRLKRPIEIVEFMNDKNSQTSAVLKDALENLLELRNPKWWQEISLQDKQAFLTTGEGPRYELVDGAHEWPIVACHTADLYLWMATDMWRPRFLDYVQPWDEIVQEVR